MNYVLNQRFYEDLLEMWIKLYISIFTELFRDYA